jgi:hypothetical protein
MSINGFLTDGIQADVWRIFKPGAITLVANGTYQQGQLFCRDILSVQGRNDTLPTLSKGDLVVLPTSANAGFNHGVLATAVTNGNAGASATVPLNLYYSGSVPVRVAALAGGTAVTIGSYVQVSAALGASTYELPTASGTYTVGQTLGIVGGYQINTFSSGAVIAAGAQTVPMATVWGITTSTPITFDYNAQGLTPQEVVTPTTVTQAVNATGTVTIAGTASAGTTIVTTLGNVPGGNVTVTYTTTAADTTATIVAGKIAALFNQTTAVRYSTPGVNAVTNAAGVITFTANSLGTAGNNYTLVTTATGGTFTSTASGATLAGGTFPSITATFVNAHATGAQVVGQNTTSGATIVAVPSTGSFIALVNVDIPSIT